MKRAQPAASSERARTVLLVISALACLAGEYLQLRPLVYVAKPLATIAVLLMAARALPLKQGRGIALGLMRR